MTSPAVHNQWRRVHIKPAKSEEDNLKNLFFSPPGSPSTAGPDEKSHLSILWSKQQRLSAFLILGVKGGRCNNTNSTV